MSKKYFDIRPISPSSIPKAYSAYKRFYKFFNLGYYADILVRAVFFYDNESGEIKISNIDEILREVDEGLLKEFMGTLNENIAEYRERNLYKEIKFFKSLKKSECFQADNYAIYYYLNSLFRSANIGTSELARSITKFSVLKRIVQIINEMGAKGEIDFLDAKFSVNSDLCEYEFPRDCSFSAGDKLFFPNDRFAELYKDKRFSSRKIILDDIRYSQKFKHLNFHELPFYLEGGNVIVTDLRSEASEMVILFSISDICYSGKEYRGSYFLDEKSVLIKIEDIDCAEGIIAKYFKDIGILAIPVRRNLSKHSIDELYHLDVIVNVALDCVILPEEDLIMKESKEKLLELFKGKCIFTNIDERKKLGSNFINFGDFVIFTNEDTPKSLIDKFNEMGFDCVVPPINISLADNDGVRCATINLVSATQIKKLDKTRF